MKLFDLFRNNVGCAKPTGGFHDAPQANGSTAPQTRIASRNSAEGAAASASAKEWAKWNRADGEDGQTMPGAMHGGRDRPEATQSACDGADEKPSRGGDMRGKRGGEVAKAPTRTALQGEWGERKAEEWLKKNAGLVPIARRVKVGRDELDLVMRNPPKGQLPEEIVFVEVKTRSSKLFGGGMGAVDKRKRHALGRAASRWMMRNADCPMRIDVVEVYGDFETDRVDDIHHQVAAVPLERRLNVHALGRGVWHPARRGWR